MTIKRKTPLKRSTKPLRRTELKRGTVRLKRTALKPTKPRGRARPDERLATWCEAQTPACTGRAEHRHHRCMRSQSGGDERENTLDACHACHSYIHAHPAESYERGWLIKGGSA